MFVCKPLSSLGLFESRLGILLAYLDFSGLILVSSWKDVTLRKEIRLTDWLVLFRSGESNASVLQRFYRSCVLALLIAGSAAAFEGNESMDLAGHCCRFTTTTIPLLNWPLKRTSHFRLTTPTEFAEFVDGTRRLLEAVFNTPSGPGGVVPGGAGGAGGAGAGAGAGAGGLVLMESSLLGATLILWGIGFDLTYELYEWDQEDWDGDGISNWAETEPDIYHPTDLVDAMIHVVVNSGPNSHPEEAFQDLGLHIAVTVSNIYVWWNYP